MNEHPITEITTTVSTPEQARAIAETLLKLRLVGCIQISDSITSHYQWEGKQCCDAELRCTIKTTISCAERAITKLEEIHPYDTPEILTSEKFASEPYSNWLRTQVD